MPSDAEVTEAVEELVEWAQRTSVARALLDAKEEKAEREAELARRAAEEEAAAHAARVYDPGQEPDDPTLYEGTGIGALYGLPGSEKYLAELGDWTLGRESS
jgi:hypothetical protein